ncbi:hypothetical protein DKT69_17520 [Micromonospora sicca]|uniref:Uncharacterized protein n=1 Tax=Micromonospora sicca TaxID=2202420 RepID=A0A317DIK1_9ACTN|nr:hypothetical protein [Micromonospora sp. 4G51]PWR14202.1 hypothetical protein DKT69_17520 [Micromonospora sp. 4G51]
MFPPDLERTKDRLYAAFAHHRLPPDMEACDHCVDPAEVELFRCTPLRDLAPDQLGTYLSNPGTWGDGTELPHLVPRLLEGYAIGEMADWWSPETVACRIEQRWRDWSPAERSAVEEFFRAWWRWTLTSCPATNPAWDLLEAVASLGLDVGGYLADFAELSGEEPARHLAEVLDSWAWGGLLPEDAKRVVGRWLVAGTPARLLWEAAVTSAPSPVADELTKAAELADLLRGALADEGV